MQQSYQDKVFKFLSEMKVGDSVNLDDIVVPENRNAFIDIAKMFIEQNRWNKEFYVELSSDYSGLRKVAITPTKEKAMEEAAQKSAEHNDWTKELTELESFFSSIDLPKEPIQFNKYTKVMDVSEFVSGHLGLARSYNGNPRFVSYLQRLREMRFLLSAGFCEKGN